jgi:hypothetical protein
MIQKASAALSLAPVPDTADEAFKVKQIYGIRTLPPKVEEVFRTNRCRLLIDHNHTAERVYSSDQKRQISAYGRGRRWPTE